MGVHISFVRCVSVVYLLTLLSFSSRPFCPHLPCTSLWCGEDERGVRRQSERNKEEELAREEQLDSWSFQLPVPNLSGE